MRIRPLVIVFSLVLAVVAGASWLPLRQEEHLTFSPVEAATIVHLRAGETLRQGYRAVGEWQSGLIVYTHSPVIYERLELLITDARGVKRARGIGYASTYLEADDTVRVHFPVPWFRTTDREQLYAELRLVDGAIVPLRATDTDRYRGGTLQQNGQALNQDLSLGVVRPAQLAAEVRWGALAAGVFTVTLSLIYLFAPSRWQWWLTGLLLIAVTPLALGGFWFSTGTFGIADWDYYFTLHEYYRQSILEHHAFPLWNPYTCGGTAGLADPEFPGFSPTFLLELIFGIPIGLRLASWTTVAVTAVGMLVLGRRLQLSLLAAAIAALGAAFGSVSILEIVEGHVNVFASMWLPWILWSWLGAIRATRQLLPPSRWWQQLLPRPSTWLCSLFLALAFFQGGIYLLMYTTAALLFLSLCSGQPLQALLTTWRAGAGALGLVALKLIPVLLWLRHFPDESYASSAYLLPWLDEILWGRHRHGASVIFRQTSGWHEYGAYVGLPLLALALLGSVRWRRSRVVWLLMCGVIIATLLATTGPALKPLFDAVPYIPRSNISRVMIYAVISVSLLAGFGLDHLRHRFSLRRHSLLPLVAVGVVAIDLMSLSFSLSSQSFVLPPPAHALPPAPVPPEFTQERFASDGQDTATTRTYHAARAGYGTFAYCSVLGPHPAVETIQDEGDIHPYVRTVPTNATTRIVSWSPNRTVVAVTATEPTRVILNTNYAPGWRVNGEPADHYNARVATTVPSGNHVVEFRYYPPGLLIGLVVTVSTILGAGWQFDRLRMGATRASGA